MSKHIASWVKDVLQGQAWGYLSRIDWRNLAAALVIATFYLKTLTNKYGILPLISLALLGGAWYAGTRTNPARTTAHAAIARRR